MFKKRNFKALTWLKPPQATRWLLVSSTWVAFLVRVVNLAGQSLWRDEVDAIRFSDAPWWELVSRVLVAGHNGPLFYVLLWPWRNLTGNSEFALRFPSALLGVLAIPLGYKLTRLLGFNRYPALLLGLLLATSPYLVWYGQEAKMYTLLLVLITVAFIVYFRILVGRDNYISTRRIKNWPNWAIFVTATSLSYYTHILAPLMLPVYGVVALLYPHRWRQHWRGWLVSMALLTLPYLPLAWWQLPLLTNGFQSGHIFYSLREEFWLLLKLYSGGFIAFAPADLLAAAAPALIDSTLIAGLSLPIMGLIPISLFIFLFLAGVFLPPRPGQPGQGRLRLTLAAWTLLPPLAVYLVSLRVPVFEDRYLIYIIPAFYLLIAVGLGLVWPHSRRLAVICLGLLVVINLTGIWQQQRRPHKADFRAAAAYLLSQPAHPAVIMVQIPYLQYTLNYYYRAKYKRLDGLWTNDGKSEDTVDTEMAAATGDLSDLWLVVSEEELWDNRGLARAWLNQHADKVAEAHFTRVDVYHYRLRPGDIENQSGN